MAKIGIWKLQGHICKDKMFGGLWCKKIRTKNVIWTKSRGLDAKWRLIMKFIQNQGLKWNLSKDMSALV
jgi:hypothetical protein